MAEEGKVWSEKHRIYRAFIKSEEWEAIRKAAYKRADYRCNRCHKRAKLHAHHVSYERFGGKELPEDLEVLCEKCHADHHRKGKKKEKAEKRVKWTKRMRRRVAHGGLPPLPADDPIYLRVMAMVEGRRQHQSGEARRAIIREMEKAAEPPMSAKARRALKKAQKQKRAKRLVRKNNQAIRALALVATPLPLTPSRPPVQRQRRLIKMADGRLVLPSQLTEDML